MERLSVEAGVVALVNTSTAEVMSRLEFRRWPELLFLHGLPVAATPIVTQDSKSARHITSTIHDDVSVTKDPLFTLRPS